MTHCYVGANFLFYQLKSKRAQKKHTTNSFNNLFFSRIKKKVLDQKSIKTTKQRRKNPTIYNTDFRYNRNSIKKNHNPIDKKETKNKNLFIFAKGVKRKLTKAI